MVQIIATLSEFEELIKAKGKVAVDFTATWCGPCKMIGPVFEKLDASYPDIVFVKVDVDNNSDTAEKYGVNAMPTFKMFSGGEYKIDLDVVGASEPKLKAALDKLQGL